MRFDSTEVWPVRTNAGFIGRLLDLEQFRDGDVNTGLIAREVDALVTPSAPDPEELVEAAARLCARPGSSPSGAPLGFRLNAPRRAEARLIDDGGMTHVVALDTIDDAEPVNEVLAFAAGFARRYTLAQIRGSTAGAASDGTLLSPMPGRIVAVDVAAGDTVTKGQKLVTLEAMKMEHSLIAPFDGIVTDLHANEGAQVSEGMTLVRVEAKSAKPSLP